jgi:hypothetical protein
MSLAVSRECGNPGETCGALVIGPSRFCQRHDPEQATIRRRQASDAAKRSHEWRPDPELEAWADTLDFSTDEGRRRGLTEAAQLVAKGGLSVGQGTAIAALARAAEGKPKAQEKPNRPLVVEVLGNGHEAKP